MKPTNLKRIIFGAILLALPVATLLYAPVVTLASPATNEACEAIGGCEDGTDIQDVVSVVVNIFTVIVGVAAVIMIIYAGFKYITAAGDSGQLTSAKNTLIYAIIGLVVVAMAQFIVNFILQQAS